MYYRTAIITGKTDILVGNELMWEDHWDGGVDSGANLTRICQADDGKDRLNIPIDWRPNYKKVTTALAEAIHIVRIVVLCVSNTREEVLAAKRQIKQAHTQDSSCSSLHSRLLSGRFQASSRATAEATSGCFVSRYACKRSRSQGRSA